VQPIVFHIPHASTVTPADAGFSASPEQIADEIRVLTDHHTDTIYSAFAEQGDAVIIAPVSRLVVDVERFPDDQLEPMSAHGMGAVYTHGYDGAELRSSLDGREALMQCYYHPHHHALESAVAAQLSKHGRAVILDCHSFPELVRPYARRDSVTPRPEICIGTDAFHTPSRVAEALERAYLNRGYSVARNTPFAGAIVPLSAYGKDARVTSVMIELRRDIYMDEISCALHPDVSRVMMATREAVTTLRECFS
jgi:N-formylglutamate deformylase